MLVPLLALQLLDYGVIAVYFVIILAIGWRSGSRQPTQNVLLAGKNIPGWAAGLSLYAAGTSAISFMAIPAKTYSTNWTYYCVNVFQVLGLIFIARAIVPAIHRLGITSIYEYLERRFNRAVRLLGSAIFVLSQIIGRNSVVLLLPALTLSAVAGVDERLSILVMGLATTAYTVKGGFRAVIWTEVLQVFVIFGAVIAGAVYIVSQIDGGVSGVWQLAHAHGRTRLFDWNWSPSGNGVWIFLLYEIAQAATWIRDQGHVQRVFATPDVKSAVRSIWTLNLIVIPGSLLFFSLGTALYAFYQAHPDRLSAAIPTDTIFPYFVAHEMPTGFVGLVFAGIVAATMSTLAGSINSIATTLIIDFVPLFGRDRPLSEDRKRRFSYLFTVIIGGLGTVVALILAQYRLPSLFDAYLMLVGIVGGGFGGVFALGLFTRRANATGAIVGSLASIVVTLALRLYVPLNAYLNSVVAVGTCVLVGYVVSRLGSPPTGDLTGLTILGADRTTRRPASTPSSSQLAT